MAAPEVKGMFGETRPRALGAALARAAGDGHQEAPVS